MKRIYYVIEDHARNGVKAASGIFTQKKNAEKLCNRLKKINKDIGCLFVVAWQWDSVDGRKEFIKLN